MGVTRVDICHAGDHDTIDRLQAVLADLGWVADDTWHDSPLGVGLTRFRRHDGELTVFRDAWLVDAVGGEVAIMELLRALKAQG